MKKYYTDFHNVDEDLMTLTYNGGHWKHGVYAGIMLRNVSNSPSDTDIAVASVCRHPKLIIYYTDYHDVDEDVRSLIDQGGYWGYGDDVGIAFRYMNNDPLYTNSTVASIGRHPKE